MPIQLNSPPFIPPIINLPVFIVVAIFLTIAAAIDARQQRLPNLLLLSAVVGGLITELLVQWLPGIQTGAATWSTVLLNGLVVSQVIPGLAFLAIFLVFRRLAKNQLGLGDVKFIAVCALFLPWGAMLAMLMVACFLAILWYYGNKLGQRRFAFGPFLAIAYVVVNVALFVIFGNKVVF